MSRPTIGNEEIIRIPEEFIDKFFYHFAMLGWYGSKFQRWRMRRFLSKILKIKIEKGHGWKICAEDNGEYIREPFIWRTRKLI
jgi:hypothetical protein